MEILRFNIGTRARWKAKSASGHWCVGGLGQDEYGNYGAMWELVEGFGQSFISIDPKTICMSTGVKDSNGTPIFENDYVEIILKGSGEIWDEAALIEYSRLGFVYTCKDEEQPLHHLEFQMKKELVEVYVVGNKWNK